ncbi:tetratricopeptide repeat protein [Amaricoccus macauensis]|uniref:tetratricopeptide repeat protein n=1 Tax=Amaricoccus macauensis TaxID=57001 RepID=UPI003C7D5CD5
MIRVLARLGCQAVCVSALLLGAPKVEAANLSGAYLAATQADMRDDYAQAADYYVQALMLDPDNLELIQSAVVMEVAKGDVEAASALAAKLEEAMPDNQIAVLVLIADALALEDFEEASELLENRSGEVNPLLLGLARGWIAVGQQDFAVARERFDEMGGNNALGAYGQYHKALALAFAGDFSSAETIMAGGSNGPLHVDRSALAAHAQILAQIGRENEAIALLDDVLSAGFPDAALTTLRDRLAAGEEVAFTEVRSAREGAAQAFQTLANALASSESERLALIHSRLAAHISPSLVEADLLTADILEAEGQYELAEQALDQIPAESAWYVSAQIRRANVVRLAGDADGGIEILAQLTQSHPDNVETHSSLGDALRNADRFEEAAGAYSDALALIDAPQPPHWVLFYSRGISNERAGDWEAAEADFLAALRLEPDQPLVLNYLGYSMVEKKENLDEALAMIEKAVEARPDDGYITDSLGWVLYRLGRVEEAVPHMLRAVELTPDDPVINDHLGDVLWLVGREREAEFQWRRALSFGPAPDLDMERIRRKLDIGLDRVLAEEEDAQQDG